MNSELETIGKFLSALKVDTIREVKFIDKDELGGVCICGQPIKYRYNFLNKRNGLVCSVGKECLSYIADYLGWNDNK